MTNQLDKYNRPDQHKLLNEAVADYKERAGRRIGRAIGFGIGPKLKKGFQPGLECFRFYVEKKIPEETVEAAVRIEKVWRGFQTDVIETGRPVSFQAQPDRAMPGGMVGLDPRDLPPNVNPANTGTIGGIVQMGDKFCVLVSNHAMAVNGRATGAQIVIRPRDRFVNNPNDFVFATISNHVHLKQPGPNTVDCALAEIGAEYFDRVNAEFPDQIVTSRTSIKPARDMEVSRVDEIDPAKEITGKIVSLHGDPRFDFSFGSFDFENLIMIESKEAFAKPGDSGALVVGREDPDHVFKVTALVIGGSRRPDKNDQMFYTYACSFDACLEELEKTLPGQYTSIPASTLPPNVGSTSQSGPNKKIGLVFTLPPSLAAASPHEDRP